MATQYTSFLGLALPVTGELSGSWGDVVNDSITSLLDSAIAGTTTLSTDGDVTLSTTTGASNQARQAILLCSGARTALRTITAPAQSKIYTVINATTGGFSVKIVGVGPTTGVTIVAGESAVVAWNGSDFIKISNTGGGGSFTNVTISGTTTLSGLTASTALALNSSKEVVSVTNTGTGNNVLSASPTLTGTVAGASLQLSTLTSGRVTYAGASGLLQDSANLTFNGTDLTVSGAVNASTINATTLDLTNLEVTNIKAKDGTAGMQIADSTGVVSFTANPVMSGGTANGVAYLNGSKVLTTGSALTFDGTNLGVGTASPACELDVYAATNSELRLTTLSDGYLSVGQFSSGAYIGTSSSDATAGVLRLATAGTERMRITSAGFVGIGTSSPTNALSVTGNANITGNTTLGDASTDTVTVNGYMGVGGAAEYRTLLQVSGTTFGDLSPRMISSVGTIHSGATGHSSGIFTSPTTAAVAFTAADVSGLRVGSIGKGAGSTITSLHGVYIADQTQGTNNYGITSLVSSGTNKWNIYASGTAANYFAGNVGIGTTSPAYKLDVSGSANAVSQQWQVSGSNFRLRLKSGTAATTNSSQYRLYLDYLDGTSTNSYLDFYRGSAGNDGYLVFGTAGSDRMTLDASGNLGLGVTPSAWGSSNKAIQLPSGAVWAFSTTQITLGQNTYDSGAGAFVYASTAAASRYRQLAGEHAWFNAPSGTAGNAISFTQAMTLDADGDLGIGTTSPAYKLDVTRSGVGVVQRWNTGSVSMLVEADHTVNGNWFLSPQGSATFNVKTGGSTRLTIDSSGNLIQTVNTTAATLATNNTLTFSIVDNSTLRISVRGSDGTTRTATVALT